MWTGYMQQRIKFAAPVAGPYAFLVGPVCSKRNGPQLRSQANSRYPSDRRRLGTEHDSEKASHKMAKKSQLSKKKSRFCSTKTFFSFLVCEDQGIFRMYKLNTSLPNIWGTLSMVETKYGCLFFWLKQDTLPRSAIWICCLLPGVLGEFF